MSNNQEQFNPADGYAIEPEPRKASDILLSLESKVEVLQKLVFNQDMLLKLIADKTNKIFAYITELQQEYRQAQAQQAQSEEDEEEPRMIKISNEHQITEAKDVDISQRRINRAVAPVQQPAILAIPNPSQEKAPQQPATGGDKKVPVIQRVSDSTGKDVFMSSVLILDENGNEVHRTKTNAVGKWQAMLKPGAYSVKLTKTDTATKKVLELTQNITVNNSSSTLTLPVVIMRR
jgi:hypothetical protein